MLSAVQFSLATFLLPFVWLALHGAGLAVYRLFLSPLAKFPGPKLAALTRKYESYYEAVQNYEYLWKIKKLHQQYGECSELFIQQEDLRSDYCGNRAHHPHQPSRAPHRRP